MDIQKVNAVCREIARKTKTPKDGFTPKEERFLNAHVNLWWQMLCDAFGVEEEATEEAAAA